jgi:D-glycero-alpha-D-manno-heptose 1-phosphate guanylyltransferase
VISYFQNSISSLELAYVKESQPLGTGGGIRAAIEYCSEDHVLVFNGDTFLDSEISEVEALWGRYADPIIVGRYVTDTMRYGGLDINHDRVAGFKPSDIAAPGLIGAGCYVLPRRCMASYKEDTYLYLDLDFLAKFVHEMKMRVFVTNNYFIDIGVPSDYRRTQDELRIYLT